MWHLRSRTPITWRRGKAKDNGTEDDVRPDEGKSTKSEIADKTFKEENETSTLRIFAERAIQKIVSLAQRQYKLSASSARPYMNSL